MPRLRAAIAASSAAALVAIGMVLSASPAGAAVSASGTAFPTTIAAGSQTEFTASFTIDTGSVAPDLPASVTIGTTRTSGTGLALVAPGPSANLGSCAVATSADASAATCPWTGSLTPGTTATLTVGVRGQLGAAGSFELRLGWTDQSSVSASAGAPIAFTVVPAVAAVLAASTLTPIAGAAITITGEFAVATQATPSVSPGFIGLAVDGTGATGTATLSDVVPVAGSLDSCAAYTPDAATCLWSPTPQPGATASFAMTVTFSADSSGTFLISSQWTNQIIAPVQVAASDALAIAVGVTPPAPPTSPAPTAAAATTASEPAASAAPAAPSAVPGPALAATGASHTSVALGLGMTLVVAGVVGLAMAHRRPKGDAASASRWEQHHGRR